MTSPVDEVVPVAEMEGEDAEETAELQSMLAEARGYLSAQKWCTGIAEEYFGFGVGGVVATFLFRIKPAQNQDDWIWVVSGDLPTAYFVIDRAHNPKAALVVYVELMSDWVKAVKTGKGLDEVFPVDAPADLEHADLLDSRLQFITERIIPEL